MTVLHEDQVPIVEQQEEQIWLAILQEEVRRFADNMKRSAQSPRDPFSGRNVAEGV